VPTGHLRARTAKEKIRKSFPRQREPTVAPVV
jgi:hypothetical protein